MDAPISRKPEVGKTRGVSGGGFAANWPAQRRPSQLARWCNLLAMVIKWEMDVQNGSLKVAMLGDYLGSQAVAQRTTASCRVEE